MLLYMTGSNVLILVQKGGNEMGFILHEVGTALNVERMRFICPSEQDLQSMTKPELLKLANALSLYAFSRRDNKQDIVSGLHKVIQSRLELILRHVSSNIRLIVPCCPVLTELVKALARTSSSAPCRTSARCSPWAWGSLVSQSHPQTARMAAPLRRAASQSLAGSPSDWMNHVGFLMGGCLMTLGSLCAICQWVPCHVC